MEKRNSEVGFIEMERTIELLNECGDVQDVSSLRKHSRNTHVAFATVRGQSAVIKHNGALAGEQGIEVIVQQARICEAFKGEDRSRIAGILEHWPEHGVVALERCAFPSISARFSGDVSELSVTATAYGEALRFFHERSALSDLTNERVLLHRDFSPANVLLNPVSHEFCIIDMPDEIVLGPGERDIGVALFEIIRTFLKTPTARRFSKMFKVRQGFLRGYFARSNPMTLRRLLAIYVAEYRHALVVMLRYVRIWRYQDWHVQAMRLAVLLPVTILVSFTIVPALQLLGIVSFVRSDD